jgi:hypothetical protein
MMTRDELLELCPHRILLSVTGPLMLTNDAPAANAMCAVIGDCGEAFSALLRAEVVAYLHGGGCVLLVSNERELRDRAVAEIRLDLATPKGNS